MVKNMDNLSGYVIYRKYTAGSRKGVRNSDGEFGMDGIGGRQRFNVSGNMPGFDTIRGTFENGKPQSQYTSRKVAVKGALVPKEDGSGDAKAIVLKWSPVLKGSVKLVNVAADGTRGATLYDDGVLVNRGTAEIPVLQGGFVTYGADDQVIERFGPDGRLVREHTGTPTRVDDLFISYGTTRDDHFSLDVVDASHPEKCWGMINGPVLTAWLAAGQGFEVDYEYENDYRN